MAGARKRTRGRRRPTGGRVTQSPKATPRPHGAAKGGSQIGQPGRRPSSPALLLVISLLWLATGAVLFATLSATWKLVPTIVSVGIGLLFLRGAAATVARRGERPR